MPAAIVNSVKETIDRNIMIIEHQPQKETADLIIEVHKPFHPPTGFCFSKTKFGERQCSCQCSGSNCFRGCIMMKGKSALIAFRAQFDLLCFNAFPIFTFSLNYYYYYFDFPK